MEFIIVIVVLGDNGASVARLATLMGLVSGTSWGASCWESRDISSDVMVWLYGGSLARGKINQFLKVSQVEQL